MNPVTKIVGALSNIRNHPVNRNRKNKAAFEYCFIQIASRLVPGDVCVEFPNHTKLLVPPHMKGAAHYVAPGLCEFEEMSFVMHFLRPDDVFADVGANIGAFTVLAAGVAGSRGVAIEASPDTFESLSSNVRLNGLQDRVRCILAAAGPKEGEIQFTAGRGTENCVNPKSNGSNTVKVKMTTLDIQLADTPPNVLKIDVEGFETEVFAGAVNTLKAPQLRAILIEKNGLGARYGFDENTLHNEIRRHGFVPCNYKPFERTMVPWQEDATENIIYVRDVAAANDRLRAAAPYKLRDLSV
jgi:FkbM family methyltransferase